MDGSVVGYGVGEASSDEDKYAWRAAVCREEFEATPEMDRRVRYKRGRGGSHYTVAQVRTSASDIANTVLKMAKKRALVDLALTATAASQLFTQDLEDSEEFSAGQGVEAADTTPDAELRRPRRKSAQAANAGSPGESQDAGGPQKISPAQRARLYAIVRDLGRSPEEAKAFLMTMGYQSSSDITVSDYDRVVDAIRSWGRPDDSGTDSADDIGDSGAFA